MNLGKRLRFLLILLFGAALLLTLIALFSADRGSFSQLQELTDRLTKSDLERQQSLVSEKVQEPLSRMALQITERRDDLIEGVQQLASDGALRALYATAQPGLAATKISSSAKPETLQQILNGWAGAKKGVWDWVDLTDKAGLVLASWPTKPASSVSLSKEKVFLDLSAPQAPLGIPAFEFVKSGASASQLVLACGIEGKDGNFAGLLRVKISANKLLGLKLDDFLKPIRSVSSKAVVVLARGNGEELFHSSKGSYAENFSGLGQDFKTALQAMQAQGEGKMAIGSYDAKPALLVWKRVGAWQPGAGVSSLLTLVTLLPEEDFKSVASGAPLKKPAPFWSRPGILLLLLLAFAGPLSAGLFLFKREFEPLNRMVQVASQIDEQGRLPEGVEFRQERNPEINHVNLNFNFLVSQARSSSDRLRELEAAVQATQEQAGRDATTAAKDLDDLRTRLSVTENTKTALQGALEGAEKARSEAAAALNELKQELETLKAEAGIKSIENKKLLSQIQDLNQKLEEAAAAPQAMDAALSEPQKATLREEEMVRLSAINTLSTELKATLATIKEYVASMLGASGAVSERQQEFLGVVINKSARLERLIGDLVELSEIASGINPPQKEATRLAALLEESASQVRPQADQKSVSLELSGLDNLSESMIDREKLGGAIRTLLLQAVKVTSRGERVRASVISVASGCELRVADNGMGLTSDRAAKVFNQFHGVDSQAGPEFIGTGLRFSILRAVLEAQGATIRIESKGARGKEFVISLPAQAAVEKGSSDLTTKPDTGDFAGFNSIFGEMPLISSQPSIPPLPQLPKTGPQVEVPETPKPVLKEEEKAGFDAIFGTPPPPPAGKSSLPAVEFKTEVAKKPLDESELANFAAIFGDKPLAPMPELPVKPALPAELAKFDAIFGDAPKAGPAPASDASGLDDLNNMFK